MVSPAVASDWLTVTSSLVPETGVVSGCDVGVSHDVTVDTLATVGAVAACACFSCCCGCCCCGCEETGRDVIVGAVFERLAERLIEVELIKASNLQHNYKKHYNIKKTHSTVHKKNQQKIAR